MPAAQTPILPFSTGSTGMDSLIRSALIAASAAITGIIIGWLNAHGFMDPNYGLLIGGVVFGLLASAAGAAWGWIAQKRAKLAIVDHVITAATTGDIPAAIIHAANPEQLSAIVNSGAAKTPAAEVALTAALNKVQTTGP